MIETFYRFTPEMLAKWRPGQANLAWANGDTAGDTFHAGKYTAPRKPNIAN